MNSIYSPDALSLLKTRDVMTRISVLTFCTGGGTTGDLPHAGF
jgi:hypothetical protein